MLERTPRARLKALAEAAEAYVADAFGQHLALAPIAPAALPHFILDRYAMWQGALNGRKLLLMAVQEVLPTGSGVTVQYLKHREMVQQQLGADLVLLLLDRASGTFRRQMIERKIGFIAPGAQIYVPEAFLDLRERAPAFAIAHADQISPTTQVLLLAVLQGRSLEDRSLTELADELRVSIMSISRSLDELEALQLASAHHVSRQRRLRLRLGGRELWGEVRARLQSPVRKTRIVVAHRPGEIGPLAGESALARSTMLAPPRIETRAVLAASWKRIVEEQGLREATPFDDGRLEVQTWTYDPQILARNGVVDLLSLYLSVRANPDERVAQAAEELLETYAW